MVPVVHLHLGYSYGKLHKSLRAMEEFCKSKSAAKYPSSTYFAAEANLRRYRRRLTPALSQRFQTSVFMILGIALSAAIFFLELKQRLNNSYLVALTAFAILLFVLAFTLPIVTTIKLGPVALEKKAREVSPDQPEPISIPERSGSADLDDWKVPRPSPSGVPSQAPPPQQERKPTEQEPTPPKPELKLAPR